MSDDLDQRVADAQRRLDELTQEITALVITKVNEARDLLAKAPSEFHTIHADKALHKALFHLAFVGNEATDEAEGEEE